MTATIVLDIQMSKGSFLGIIDMMLPILHMATDAKITLPTPYDTA